MSQRCYDALERINHELSVEYIFIDLSLAITLSGMGEMSRGTTCYYYMTYDRVRNVVLFFLFFFLRSTGPVRRESKAPLQRYGIG